MCNTVCKTTIFVISPGTSILNYLAMLSTLINPFTDKFLLCPLRVFDHTSLKYGVVQECVCTAVFHQLFYF